MESYPVVGVPGCPLKDTLKEGHKVSFKGTKAKIVRINFTSILIKYDHDGQNIEVSDQEINTGKINVLNKRNKKAQELLVDIKSKFKTVEINEEISGILGEINKKRIH